MKTFKATGSCWWCDGVFWSGDSRESKIRCGECDAPQVPPDHPRRVAFLAAERNKELKELNDKAHQLGYRLVPIER